jgi:hypothetical protein
VASAVHATPDARELWGFSARAVLRSEAGASTFNPENNLTFSLGAAPCRLLKEMALFMGGETHGAVSRYPSLKGARHHGDDV